MAKAPLPTPELLRELFEYDAEAGVLIHKAKVGLQERRSRRAGRRAGGLDSNGYFSVSYRERRMLVHRVVWAMTHDAWPDKDIDHIDGDRGNNRLSNLRLVTPGENARNRALSKNNTSGYGGICFNRRRGAWIVTVNRKHVGSFQNKADAVKALMARRQELNECTERHGTDRNIAQGVTVNAERCGGRPCITGTRIPTSAIASFAKEGFDVRAIRREYPELRIEQVADALAFEAMPAGKRRELSRCIPASEWMKHSNVG